MGPGMAPGGGGGGFSVGGWGEGAKGRGWARQGQEGFQHVSLVSSCVLLTTHWRVCIAD